MSTTRISLNLSLNDSAQTGFGRSIERVLDPEAVGQQIAQRADAEGLRRVVAGGDEVDPSLARLGHDVLARLAGQERVEPSATASSQRSPRAPETIADRADLRGPAPSSSGARPVTARTRASSSAGASGSANAPPRPIPANADVPAARRAPGEERVVADLRVRVERQVVGGQLDVVA